MRFRTRPSRFEFEMKTLGEFRLSAEQWTNCRPLSMLHREFCRA